MIRRDIPDIAFTKLDQLGQLVEDLTQRLAKAQDGIVTARARLNGGFEKQSEYVDTRAALDQLIADKPVLEKKLQAAQRTLSDCKAWVDRLPAGTALEPVEVQVDGCDPAEVRGRLNVIQAELAALRAAPTPSADIQQRIERYVADMARPTITGIGVNEHLRVVWPGAGWDSSGPREGRADILPIMALLHGEAMVAALMREIERTADDPLPRAERKKRIAALEAEFAELAYVEEMLVAPAIVSGEDVHRSPDAPPQAVLGVQLVEAKKSRAA